MTYVQLDAVTRALFRNNLQSFLLDGWDGKAQGHSYEFTLSEFIMNPGGDYGIWDGHGGKYSVADFMKANIKSGGAMAVGQVISAHILNAMLKKAGVYRNANKLVRSVPAVGKLIKF